MTRHKRTEIRIETERALITAQRQSTRTWCPECDCDVYVIHTERVATAIGEQARAAERPVNGHSPTPMEKVLVCLESLMEAK